MRARGGGDGRPSSHGSCLVRDRNPAWRCLPTPSRDRLEPVRASPGSCDLYDVSDDLTPYAVAWGWQKALLDARLAALSAEQDDVVDGVYTHRNQRTLLRLGVAATRVD